jgi:ERI1 exoribonuclease 3
MFVKPVINVPLNHICVEITGIQQDWVDKAPLFPEVFEKYQQWLYENIIKDNTKTFCYVTCGDWDLKTMLPTQCQLSGLQSYPDYFKSWINIKDVFNERYKSKITGTVLIFCILWIESKIFVVRHGGDAEESENGANWTSSFGY